MGFFLRTPKHSLYYTLYQQNTLLAVLAVTMLAVVTTIIFSNCMLLLGVIVPKKYILILIALFIPIGLSMIEHYNINTASPHIFLGLRQSHLSWTAICIFLGSLVLLSVILIGIYWKKEA